MFSQEVTLPADADAGMFYIAAVQRDAAGSVIYKVADTIEVTAPAAAGAPASSVSPASATGDLWSGFDPGSAPFASADAPTAASSPSSTSWSLPLGLSLMIAGAAALFGGFALAEVRRRRATASQ